MIRGQGASQKCEFLLRESKGGRKANCGTYPSHTFEKQNNHKNVQLLMEGSFWNIFQDNTQRINRISVFISQKNGTTSKTPLRHPSVPDRGHPRHMIKRYVRITYDPKSRSKLSSKCSPFKQIRVEPLRHHQDTSMTKLGDIKDKYKGDMSRLSKDMSRSLMDQKLGQNYYFKSQNYCQILWEDSRDLLGSLLNASMIWQQL